MIDSLNVSPTANQKITFSEIKDETITCFIKREDLIHPVISGNKYRKLKYNILEAKKQNKDILLTFGGAFSNHISATAIAGKEFGFKTVGVIRGEELESNFSDNPTLLLAQKNGMQFYFADRETYKNKYDNHFVQKLISIYGDFYLLPEGGTNDLAIKGCEEILTEEDNYFDFICTSAGTGGTMAGIINSSKPSQQIMGFSALKGDFLNKEIGVFTSKTNWKVTDNYCFGGYAKVNKELIEFINSFKKETHIALDPVYTGKMMFGITDLIKQGCFPKYSRILAVHTGGLQGIVGMNLQLQKKNLPLIEL